MYGTATAVRVAIYVRRCLHSMTCLSTADGGLWTERFRALKGLPHKPLTPYVTEGGWSGGRLCDKAPGGRVGHEGALRVAYFGQGVVVDQAAATKGLAALRVRSAWPSRFLQSV